MAESPFPPGTEVQIIYVDAGGNVLPDKEGAVGGETIVAYPDGREEHTTFSLDGEPPRF